MDAPLSHKTLDHVRHHNNNYDSPLRAFFLFSLTSMCTHRGQIELCLCSRLVSMTYCVCVCVIFLCISLRHCGLVYLNQRCLSSYFRHNGEARFTPGSSMALSEATSRLTPRNTFLKLTLAERRRPKQRGAISMGSFIG